MSGPGVLSFAAAHGFEGFALDAAFEAPLRGTTALFGPSGSGKTTILRILAGLLTPTRGSVRLGAVSWLDTSARINLPPHRRPVGLVFQDARLFSHLSVAANLAFAAKRAKTDAAVVADIVDLLDLGALLERYPGAISGGEAQRVALGRTLLTRPKLLLLDEPMSGLDARRKAEIMPYLARLSDRYQTPTILVSHALDEVAQLAARIVLLNGGKVVAAGPTEEILADPALQAFTGRFEAGALIEAQIVRHDPELRLTYLRFGPETLVMPQVGGLAPAETIRLRIRARDVALATKRPTGITIRNILAATITDIRIEDDTAFAEVTLRCGPGSLRARVTRASVADLGLTPGASVFALIKSVTFDRRGLAPRAL